MAAYVQAQSGRQAAHATTCGGLTFIFDFLPQRAVSNDSDGEAVHLGLGHELLNSHPIVL